MNETDSMYGFEMELADGSWDSIGMLPDVRGIFSFAGAWIDRNGFEPASQYRVVCPKDSGGQRAVLTVFRAK